MRNLLTLNHNGNFLPGSYSTLQEYISTIISGEPLLQNYFCGVNYSTIPGAYIDRIDGKFLAREQLKVELDTRVVCRCPRIIPIDSKVRLEEFYGRINWSIWVIDKDSVYIASVWIGSDPENQWKSGGLIRVGKTISDTEWKVYHILARYSNGSY